MCTLNVEVVVVEPERLGTLWATAVNAKGRRVLFVRSDCPPAEVAAGMRASQTNCPIRKAFQLVA